MGNKFARPISAGDSMVKLINEEYNILPILSRFSIPLGFGSKTIGEVCDEACINTDTFLLIVNFTLSGTIPPHINNKSNALGIIEFLHNSHDYFLGYKFPHIRNNLLSAVDESHSEINPAIIHFFDEYVRQVKQHFDYEEQNVWPYIKSLVDGTPSTDYNIAVFKSHHDEIGEKLSDLKNIILRYYTTTKPNLMYDVLVDIYNCEADLNSHNEIENEILIPMISELEGIS
ncbi:MAG: hemerythrin domain-containing protein [Barnesiella sp.]|nr:hemerythrin domain-containing protein [Barnesiella sp.]MBD5255863.1 hemerythrin domain-containing protein [Barnesiella sp.]